MWLFAVVFAADPATLPHPLLGVSWYSPTTAVVRFSPSRFVLNQDRASNVNRLLLGQRTCPLSHFRQETCYYSISKDFLITETETLLSQFEFVRAGVGSAAPPACDAVTPYLYNGAAVAANTAAANPDPACRWKPTANSAQFIRLLDEQLPDPWIEGGNDVPEGGWEYTAEVCIATAGCDRDTFICLNTFAVIAFPQSQGGTLLEASNMYFSGGEVALPVSYPYHGLAYDDVGDALRYDPSSGPYRPCPVLADGRQARCSEIALSPKYDPVTQPHPSCPAGCVPPAALTLHLRGLSATTLRSVDVARESFEVDLEYDIIWSDRHAVHPCTISLYDYGAGIPRGSAALQVNASRWWSPDPGPLAVCPREGQSAAWCDAAASPSSVSVDHAEKLTVMRGPDTEVVKPCRNAGSGQPARLEDAWSEECVWPIQLYLKDSIKVIAKYKTKFNLDKYPLDKHLLVADLELATNFATHDSSYTVDAPSIDAANVAKAAADFYTGSAWKVQAISYELRGGATCDRLSGGSCKAVRVTLQLERSGAGVMLLRIILPALANAGIVTYAGRVSNPERRIKLVALSFVAGVFLLDPATFGMPRELSSMPFVMSLTLIHMLVTAVILILSIMDTEYQYRLKNRVLDPDGDARMDAAAEAWTAADHAVAPLREAVLATARETMAPEAEEAPEEPGVGRKVAGVVGGAVVHAMRAMPVAERLVAKRPAPTATAPALAPAAAQRSPAELPPAAAESGGEGSVVSSGEARATALRRLDEIATVLAVLPDFLNRASKEPTGLAVENHKTRAFDAWHDRLDTALHYYIFPAFVLLWAVAAAVYAAQPDPW